MSEAQKQKPSVLESIQEMLLPILGVVSCWAWLILAGENMRRNISQTQAYWERAKIENNCEKLKQITNRVEAWSGPAEEMRRDIKECEKEKAIDDWQKSHKGEKSDDSNSIYSFTTSIHGEKVKVRLAFSPREPAKMPVPASFSPARIRNKL